jgi:hypothetical protein
MPNGEEHEWSLAKIELKKVMQPEAKMNQTTFRFRSNSLTRGVCRHACLALCVVA